jgi:hypothetical protein
VTGETVRDSGNGENDGSGDGTVQGTFLKVHEVLESHSVAWQYPSSGARPATISLIHPSGEQYLFTELFEDKTIPPNIYDVKIEDGKVLLNSKKALTHSELDKYGAETAAKYMAWQDFSGFSLPSEEDQQDLARCFADYITAVQDGTLTPFDISDAGPGIA